MASAGSGGTLPPNFLLTPQQQSLLFAALNSNRPQASGSSSDRPSLALSPNSFETSPMQDSGASGFQESPYLDNYNYDDVGDSSFDFSLIDDQSKMIGDLPETVKSESSEADGIEKRSHPDDDDEGNGSKRRESTDKVPKKPGRKPLTSEPSSVRRYPPLLAHPFSCAWLMLRNSEAQGAEPSRSAGFQRAKGAASEELGNQGRGAYKGIGGRQPREHQAACPGRPDDL